MSEPIDLSAELADYGTSSEPATTPPGQPPSIGRLADMQQQGFTILPDTTPLHRTDFLPAWTASVGSDRCHQCQRYLPNGKECPECPPKIADIPVPDQPFAWKPRVILDSPKIDIQVGDGFIEEGSNE